MKAFRARSAYSLVELLVVIAIIGLLLSLLLPAVVASRSSAQQTKCLMNLHNIGVAFSQQLLSRGGKNAVSPNTWQADLTPVLKTKEIFLCPNAPERQGAGTVTCRVTHGGWPEQEIPFEPGPRCQKKNETANSYELWFEDWNNWDYRDLRVLVEQQPDGSDKITVIQVDSSSTFDILGEDGSPLLARVTRNNWPGRSCTTRVALPGYGINNRCNAMTIQDGRKIVLLDFSKSVADVVGADASDSFSSQVAPRHRSCVNVLFLDSSAKAFDPDEIDPADLKIHDTLWKPTADSPLASRH